MSTTTTPSTHSLGKEGSRLFEPGVLGLLSLAAVTVHLALFQGGILGPDGLGVGLSYGAFGLLCAGLTEWKHRNPFGAVTFCALGLFATSLFALVVLPGCGFGRAPAASSLAAYLGMWSLFCALLASGAGSYGLAHRTVLGLLTLFLLLMTIAAATQMQAISALAALAGFGCTAAAVCAGLLQRLRGGQLARKAERR